MTQDLDLFMAALPCPVLLIGPDERILRANSPARVLLPTAVIGGHYVTALRQPAVLDAVETVLRGQGAPTTADYLAGTTGRETVWRVTVDRAGRDAAVTFEDRTALTDAERMRSDFIANVSHELRTPLTALIGFIDTLQGPARDDPAARTRFLGIMGDEAGRMVRLVEDLLSLRRVEEQERIRPTDPVDLGDLVTSVARTMAPLAERRGMVVTLDLPTGPVTVPGDAGQLRQVLTNLIENALKYGGSPVSVRLHPSDANGMVSLTVTDAGDGIAAHHLPRLTERFYRVDSHRSRSQGGTGLGLAIVKHILNRHRGRLRITSEVGQGAVFRVELAAK
jgi:two-component system, OmpR family, phosphate regulon sensor histidine kinase PhoR